MFSLYQKINDEVEVSGIKYPLNASFDVMLKLIDLLKEKRLSDINKLKLSIMLVFGRESQLLNISIEDQGEAIRQVFDGYLKSSKNDKPVKRDLQGNVMPELDEEEKKVLYSINYDAEYIYASFMQAYGLDLLEQQGKLHWFKFKALLSGLPEDTKFEQVMSIRSWKKPSNSKNAHETQMKKLQEIYALPDTESEVT
ncbi:bacteriophage Gp15 family protein [Lactococcus lactis]|uniref:Gp15 family bacteriophage protein n=1 Tax=Lactococcus lactis TaxID=1358 RepID=UPI002416CF80|nr:Gp15 family bacteriophage protein [Lactococcus lactis]MDG4985501.1 bacteriophage Gp15 family protein [Lactococcus lactis]